MHVIEALILAISCDETMQTSLPRAVLILDITPTIIYFIIIDVVVVVNCGNLRMAILLLDLLLLVLYLLADNSILENPSELRVELIKFRVIILRIL